MPIVSSLFYIYRFLLEEFALSELLFSFIGERGGRSDKRGSKRRGRTDFSPYQVGYKRPYTYKSLSWTIDFKVFKRFIKNTSDKSEPATKAVDL